MPIKKDKVKKKLKDSIRPSLRLKKKATKKTKEITPVVKYIFTERVPKKKCCTDVEKTGQAYTIPFGYADRLGTTRLETPTPTVAPRAPSVSSLKPISEKKEYLTIETQTEPIKKRTYIKSGKYAKPIKAEEVYTEYELEPIFKYPSPFSYEKEKIDSEEQTPLTKGTVGLIQAEEVKSKRKYVKSGKYKKKKDDDE